ncbi:LysR substrate-binding domain-containing protein [Luteibacter aegosomaticola]|uniref:LysR substrate-binding domain-containing protein n=1 Tax=Luteibacter aegosomaticola TaxID=2911538 RepID=UPI001FFBA40D|nr:LysR substrate-binding domain-containing protein [Luteibacter aegosomaticola]UPG92197.1 LysR substrate-binding domain-containing protein [Luteibacter aegosomaticola]
MSRLTFDLDVIRSFVTGVELGSFSKAAERLGRSTSAISAQLKKLEDQVDAPLLRKAGRGLALTETGEVMLAYGRRLLDLNDEAASAMQGTELAGSVRLGLQEDFGESVLPEVLGLFRRAHPRLHIEVQLARNTALLDGVRSGRLDMALAWQTDASSIHAEHITTLAMRWIAAEGANAPDSNEPMPLVVLDAPCLMRAAAIDALDYAHRPWRIAFTSPSLAGTWAAVRTGWGLSVRTELGLPPGVQVLDAEQHSLPPLPALGLALYSSHATKSVAGERLATMIKERLHDALGAMAGRKN